MTVAWIMCQSMNKVRPEMVRMSLSPKMRAVVEKAEQSGQKRQEADGISRGNGTDNDSE